MPLGSPQQSAFLFLLSSPISGVMQRFVLPARVTVLYLQAKLALEHFVSISSGRAVAHSETAPVAL